ncbi:MFS general substrate transporter [Aspergillus indologenus CBS 114.80]|uniref:MFS general substrate transporter n=1 Tax=Aspergillus indologenus CBS 114.80 TaxID=1450541 RepID=A0A2V5IH82_9EURO|nr:MFS general substrate transporter [Aspergillus indologenus CBS 114.80]
MLGYAVVFGLKEDLHLKGDEYSWLASMFYFGYLASEYLSSLVMQKLSVPKWLAANMIVWGGITMALAACHGFQSFLALRFLLGGLESCSTPAYLLITATWYTVEEQPIRIGWWSTFLGVANSFGGLLAFLIGHIYGSLASWQYQFIILGAVSVGWGAFMMFTLADGPYNASWLAKKKEKLLSDALVLLILGNLSRDQTVSDPGSTHGPQDMALLPLRCIPYGMVILVSNISAMYLQRWLPGQKRCIVACLYVCPAVAGAVGLRTISRTYSMALLVCYWLTSTYTASFAMIMSLITANTAGATKRSTVNAVFFIAYCVGNIVGPFSFKSSEAPTYTSGIVTMLVAYCVEIVLLLVVAVYMAWLNQRRDAVVAAEGVRVGDAAEQVDLTDRENVYFRYSY